MFRKICIYSSIVFLIASVLLMPGCNSRRKSVPERVRVDFEIQLINATATAWGYGIDGGQGFQGWGAINEVIHDWLYVTVGERVFIKAFGKQFSSSDPAHQLIGRIIVNDEEIYMCADQGSPNEETKIECRGPVYIPDDEQ